MSEWYQHKADKISAVWSKLTGLYGNRLLREFGDTAPEEWANIIGILPDHELARGLRKLIMKGTASVPTLPQFYAACKYADDEDSRPDLNASQVALPAPEFMEPVWAHCQKCLFAYLWKSKLRATEAQLQQILAIKNRMVIDFRNLIAEGEEVTGSEIRDALFRAWGCVISSADMVAA